MPGTEVKRKRASGVPEGLIIGMLLLGLAVYILYHGLSSVGNHPTTAAVTLSDTRYMAEGRGCIFRNEVLVSTTDYGVIEPLTKSGERVSADTPLVRIYVMDQVAAELATVQLKELDEAIALLEFAEAGADMSLSEADALDAEIYGRYAEWMIGFREGRYSSLNTQVQAFERLLSRYNVLTGSDSYSQDLKKMREKRAELIAEWGTPSVVSSRACGSGYFYPSSEIDGYEEICTLKALGGLTVQGLKNLMNQPVGNYDELLIGKNVKNNVWYLAVVLPATTAQGLEADGVYEVSFLSSGITLPLTVEKVSVEGGSGEGLVIFRSDRIPTGFDFARWQDIQILLKTSSGFRIPDDARVRVEGVDGVYILDGRQVLFRRISITGYEDGYVLVAAEDPTPEADGYYLSANDLLILSGEQLHDGQIIN